MAEQQPGVNRLEVRVDESKMSGSNYANTVRTTTLADAVVLDFGINMPPTTQQDGNVAIFQAGARVVMPWSTAKRMASSLAQAVENYEKQFGEVRPPQPIQQGG